MKKLVKLFLAVDYLFTKTAMEMAKALLFTLIGAIGLGALISWKEEEDPGYASRVFGKGKKKNGKLVHGYRSVYDERRR